MKDKAHAGSLPIKTKRLTPGRFSREGRAGLFLSLRAGGSIPRFEAGEGYN